MTIPHESPAHSPRRSAPSDLLHRVRQGGRTHLPADAVRARTRGAGSQLTAIGAFERATLGYFDRKSKSYRRIAVDEEVELLSFLEDIAHSDGEPVVHVHVVLGLPDGSTRGGHLLDASVWPTLELVLTEWPKHLCKRSDAEVGLPLLPGSTGAEPRGG